MGVRVQVAHPRPGSEEPLWRVELDDDEAPWLAVLSFAARGNPKRPAEREWQCLGYELRAKVRITEDTSPGDVVPITADVHRHVADRWERFLDMARSGLEFSIEEAVRETAPLRARGQGRRGLPEEFYRQIAEQYRQALAQGDNPTSAIAKAHGVARSTASNWIAACRDPKRGYLGPATPGKAG